MNIGILCIHTQGSCQACAVKVRVVLGSMYLLLFSQADRGLGGVHGSGQQRPNTVSPSTNKAQLIPPATVWYRQHHNYGTLTSKIPRYLIIFSYIISYFETLFRSQQRKSRMLNVYALCMFLSKATLCSLGKM